MNHSDYKKFSVKPQTEIIGYLRSQLHKDHSQHNTQDYRTQLLRTICNHIAGMTDRFTMKQYELLYGSKQIG
jgi:dGTP triphosphohydrolase